MHDRPPAHPTEPDPAIDIAEPPVFVAELTGTPAAAALRTEPHRAPHLDLLVSLQGSAAIARQDRIADVFVTYVPDRLVLVADSLGDYLNRLGLAPPSSLEALAAGLQEDLTDLLVPRLLRLKVELHNPLRLPEWHRVETRETQPGWDNAALLAAAAPGFPVPRGANQP